MIKEEIKNSPPEKGEYPANGGRRGYFAYLPFLATRNTVSNSFPSFAGGELKKHSLIRSFAYSLIVCGLMLGLSSCQKDDANLYGVNNENLLPPGAGKTKIKSNEQYVSILYANLFQQALSANSLYDISKCIESIGDKDVAKEVIISNFMNKPNVQLPADSTMRNNVPQFVTDTYNRFLVRNPTEAEKTWFTNFINANPNVTPELVYFSFALCNEYQYY